MIRRRDLLRSGLASVFAGAAPTLGQAQVGAAALVSGRARWVEQLERVARPVLEALAAGRLRATMPVEARPEMAESRRRTTHLEAFGRLMSGIAPWLESPPSAGTEGELRRKYVGLAHEALGSALDPKSPDALLCANAFLPLGLAPEERFWAGADAPWTAQKVWAGLNMPADHALGGQDMGPVAPRR